MCICSDAIHVSVFISSELFFMATGLACKSMLPVISYCSHLFVNIHTNTKHATKSVMRLSDTRIFVMRVPDKRISDAKRPDTRKSYARISGSILCSCQYKSISHCHYLDSLMLCNGLD